MRSYAIEASGLTKRFGNLVAVDHISFRVEEGEFFGFLGPNGAGKTTTMRMLTGVIKPDEGEAHVMGFNIHKEPVKAKELMGIVPEMANAYIDLTAWQNLMFMGELYGIPKTQREKQATDLMNRLGLYERRSQLVKGFSRGMKQRLLICMALINNPRVLFLDEPTSGLDVQSARLIRELLKELNKTGITIFLTTHNLEEASQLCEKIAIINYGRIAAIDSPEKLKLTVKGLQSVEVVFNKPVREEDLTILPNAKTVSRFGDKIRIQTEKPGDLVAAIVDYARSEGLKLVTVNVLTPTLEDVFLEITGESLAIQKRRPRT